MGLIQARHVQGHYLAGTRIDRTLTFTLCLPLSEQGSGTAGHEVSFCGSVAGQARWRVERMPGL